MLSTIRPAIGGRGAVRAVLAAAVVLTAMPCSVDAQRGATLQLESLEVVELGRVRSHRGDVTRWGLRYRRGSGSLLPARIQVTLERGQRRSVVRHLELHDSAGTVAIGPSRGVPRIHVRALDSEGRPQPIRIGHGPRQDVIALDAVGRRAL